MSTRKMDTIINLCGVCFYYDNLAKDNVKCFFAVVSVMHRANQIRPGLKQQHRETDKSKSPSVFPLIGERAWAFFLFPMISHLLTG